MTDRKKTELHNVRLTPEQWEFCRVQAIALPRGGGSTYIKNLIEREMKSLAQAKGE